MSQHRLTLANAGPLFLVLFIDTMGLGLFLPIVNALIIDPSTQFLSLSVSEFWRQFTYGAVLGVFMLCWFFGATIMGDLSDSVGRKRALLLCLLGSFLGYALTAIAIIYKSITFIVIGRMIAGFTAGSQPIAQAAIVDMSTPVTKAKNLGLITLATSLGFVFGPVIGGVLSDARIISGVSYDTPMIFASAISLLNALILWLTFQETHQRGGKIKLQYHRAIELFLAAFQNERVAELSSAYLLMILGWSSFFSFLPIYTFQRYHFDVLQSSLFLALMGCGFSISCGFLVRLLAPRFDLQKTVVVCFLLTGLLILLTLIFQFQWVAWTAVLCIGLAMGVGFAEILTLFSNQVGDEEQGWVMGITGSVMALCFAVVDLLVGLLARYGAAAPMLVAVFGFIASAGVMHFSKLRNTRSGNDRI